MVAKTVIGSYLIGFIAGVLSVACFVNNQPLMAVALLAYSIFCAMRIAAWALKYVGPLGFALLIASTATADCHRRQQIVYQQQVAYAVPVVYAPLVFYQAGDELRIEAAVERALRLRDEEYTKGYQAPVQAPVQAPIQAPVQAPVKAPIQAPVKGKGYSNGGLEPLQNVQVGVFTKCARCHTGDNAEAGLVLDGTTFIDSRAYFRWSQIAIQGREVPQKMQAMVAAMTDQEKARINDALMSLVVDRPRTPPVQPEPPPPPVADGGLQ